MLFVCIECVVATVFDKKIPVSAPELATAYLIQSRAAVPKKLLSITADGVVPVIVPELVIPVTAVTVPEVAKPRNVLFVILSVLPVAAFLIPIINDVLPVDDVSTPALDKFAPDKV